jgi:hypothetical protein
VERRDMARGKTDGLEVFVVLCAAAAAVIGVYMWQGGWAALATLGLVVLMAAINK